MSSTISRIHKLIVLYLFTMVSATFAGPYTWWTAAKGTFNTTGKTIFSHKATYALPIGITANSIFTSANDHIHTLNFLQAASNQNLRANLKIEIDVIQKFIHEELKKQNFPHPEQIHLIPSNLGPSVASNFFLISESFRKKCIKAGILHTPLETIMVYNDETGEYEKKEEIWHTLNAEESQTKLKEIKNIIGHEAGHLIANDHQKNIATNYCLPALTGFSCLTFIHKLNSYIPSTRIKGLLITMSTIPLVLINAITKSTYLRFTEYRADEHVPNEADYLEGGISYFERRTSKEKKSTHNVYNNKLIRLLSVHPTSESRANRFKERLEKLQQKKLIL